MPFSVDGFFESMKGAMDAISCTGPRGRALERCAAVERCVKIIAESSRRGGVLYMAGNGGSASIASHITVDLWKNAGVKALAFNDSSLLTCLGNDLGYEQVFAAPLSRFAAEGDVVVLISSSGKSPNMLAAARMALKKGCRLITLTGFKPGNPLRRLGEVNFHVPYGEYGFVETAHAAIAHSFVDGVMAGVKRR